MSIQDPPLTVCHRCTHMETEVDIRIARVVLTTAVWCRAPALRRRVGWDPVSGAEEIETPPRCADVNDGNCQHFRRYRGWTMTLEPRPAG